MTPRNSTYERKITAINAAHDRLIEAGIDNFDLARDVAERVLMAFLPKPVKPTQAQLERARELAAKHGMVNHRCS